MFKDTPTVCVCVFLRIEGAKVGGCLLVFFLLFVFTNKERAEITVRKPDRFERNGGVNIPRIFLEFDPETLGFNPTHRIHVWYIC